MLNKTISQISTSKSSSDVIVDDFVDLGLSLSECESARLPLRGDREGLGTLLFIRLLSLLLLLALLRDPLR